MLPPNGKDRKEHPVTPGTRRIYILLTREDFERWSEGKWCNKEARLYKRKESGSELVWQKTTCCAVESVLICWIKGGPTRPKENTEGFRQELVALVWGKDWGCKHSKVVEIGSLHHRWWCRVLQPADSSAPCRPSASWTQKGDNNRQEEEAIGDC